jgi:hypothetical protein
LDHPELEFCASDHGGGLVTRLRKGWDSWIRIEHCALRRIKKVVQPLMSLEALALVSSDISWVSLPPHWYFGKPIETPLLFSVPWYSAPDADSGTAGTRGLKSFDVRTRRENLGSNAAPAKVLAVPRDLRLLTSANTNSSLNVPANDEIVEPVLAGLLKLSAHR